MTLELAAFIAALDTAFLGTVSGAGAPYIQHRGGPMGFIKVLDEKTLGFADFAGNRQYEAIRKPERAVDFDRSASRREVADRARDSLTAELDGSGFQHAVAGRDAVFVHECTGG